jgi:hypothetical protein
MKSLPTEYYLEVYEGSLINDPSWSVESSTPFLAIAKGDRFNHLGLSSVAWYNEPQSGQYFRVKDIEHIVWVIESSHIGHKILVSLELMEGE